MKGVGKTIRENAEAGYLYHCREAATVLLHIERWNWRRWVNALVAVSDLPLAITALLLAPITVPIAGYTRLRYYRRQVEEWEARQAKVNELHK